MSDEPENGPTGKTEKEPTRLSFSLPQLIGSAAAAMTVAYVGSSLGTAGTILGAALASVVGAVAGTVYTAGLDHTGRRLGSVMQQGWTRIRRADPKLDSDGEQAEEVAGAGGTPSANPEPPRDKGRTWRRITLRVLTAAAAIFAVSFVAITGWELLTGTSLDGREGTTVGQVVRPERTAAAEPEPEPTPSEPTVSETPTAEATPTEPTPEPSESVTPEPTPTPVETPTPAEPAEPVPTHTPVASGEPEPNESSQP